MSEAEHQVSLQGSGVADKKLLSTTWQREAVGGFVAGAVTDAVFYCVDSYKAQLQSGSRVDVRRMARGLCSLSLISNGPSLALFFASYDALKRHPWVGNNGFGVLLASLLCAVPASIIAVPGDTLKKRVVLGLDATPRQALRSALASSSYGSGLMVGWHANLMKDVPFAALKMSLYEGLLRGWAAVAGKPLEMVSPSERGGLGFVSGVVTAVVTNPLDVVNTRIKGQLLPAEVNGIINGMRHVAQTEGLRSLGAGLAPRVFIIGTGSSLFFWVLEQTKAVYDSHTRTKDD